MQSLISPSSWKSNELDASVANATKTGQDDRDECTEREDRGGVLASESADHTSQGDGPTEGRGACWRTSIHLPPHKRCSRDQRKSTRRHVHSTTPLDNTAPTARVGTLTLHHPGCGVTRGPCSTPTVHRCPSRRGGRGWLNHARNKCTQRCTSQHGSGAVECACGK